MVAGLGEPLVSLSQSPRQHQSRINDFLMVLNGLFAFSLCSGLKITIFSMENQDFSVH